MKNRVKFGGTFCALWIASVFLAHSAPADGLLGTTSEDSFNIKVELSEAPKMIQISGLSDISIEKTAGDAAIADQESTACVYMEQGIDYGVKLTADPLTNTGKHYPYKVEVYQSSTSNPSIALSVTDTQLSREKFGFVASTDDSCSSAPKLNIRVTDVGSDDFTSAFSATATVKIMVFPE